MMQNQQVKDLGTPLDHYTPAAAARDVIVRQALQSGNGRDRCVLPIHRLRHFTLPAS
jgi:hypothetical protein